MKIRDDERTKQQVVNCFASHVRQIERLTAEEARGALMCLLLNCSIEEDVIQEAIGEAWATITDRNNGKSMILYREDQNGTL